MLVGLDLIPLHSPSLSNRSISRYEITLKYFALLKVVRSSFFPLTQSQSCLWESMAAVFQESAGHDVFRWQDFCFDNRTLDMISSLEVEFFAFLNYRG